MNESLTELYELEAIRQLKYRYARCVDLRDYKAIEGMLAEGFTWLFSTPEAPEKIETRDRTGYLKIMYDRFPPEVIAQHHMHHPEIALTGAASAEGTWYLEYSSANTKTRQSARGTSLYHDLYVKEGGAWKFKQMRYRVVFRIEEPLRPEAKIVVHYAATVHPDRAP